jgi:hypothetical protein
MNVGYILFGGLVGAATLALAAGLFPIGVTGAIALFLIAGNVGVAAAALRRIRGRTGRRPGPWARSVD